MSTSINSFKLYTEYLSNKAQAGGTLSPSQFIQLANQAQLQVFEKDFQSYQAGGVLSEFLSFFLTNTTTGVPLTGKLNYPADFQHTSAIRSYYLSPGGEAMETPVTYVENNNWGAILSSQLTNGSKEFPKFTEFSTEYRFTPRNIGIVMVDYFKTPVVPVWGYTVVSGRPVYDVATSTDFEWDSFALNNVAGMFLSLIGVNLKDSELSQFSQMYKQETNMTA